MNQRIRQGVVLREICGEYVLVAGGKASAVCPPLRQLNDTGAFFWKLIEEDCSEEEMVRKAAENFEADAQQIRPSLRRFREMLEKEGYLLKEEE